MKYDQINPECYLEMVKVMEKTEDLIGQYTTVESERVQSSMVQLIVTYYSKPFLGIGGTCRIPDEVCRCEHRLAAGHCEHRLRVEEIEFSQEERAVHDLVYASRSQRLADSAQAVEGIPDTCVDRLSLNVSKIKGHLQAKINQA